MPILYANLGWKDPRKNICPFCREPAPDTYAEVDLNMMKRVEKNDPVAVTQMGKRRYNEGDYSSAFEYWRKAAELGDADAHFKLARLYFKGDGVEKDEKKAFYHWEEAAIGGHPDARCILAAFEMENCRHERAVKHYTISANLGNDNSIKELWKFYAKGMSVKMITRPSGHTRLLSMQQKVHRGS